MQNIDVDVDRTCAWHWFVQNTLLLERENTIFCSRLVQQTLFLGSFVEREETVTDRL